MKRARSDYTSVWKTLFWVYIAALIVIVSFKGLSDLPGYWASRTSPDWTPRYNLEPLRTLKSYFNNYGHPVHLKNIWGNILPFVPMGLLLPLAFGPTRGFFRTSGLCFLLITAIESAQLITGLGSFDVDDILLNVLSCMLGYILYKLFGMPAGRTSGRGGHGRRNSQKNTGA